MQMQVVDTSGKNKGKVSLPNEIFDCQASPKLLSQAIRVYLSNQRKAHAKAKTRGEVRGSGRKIYRQKGTGRARHGDRYANIFVGGGVVHGPTGRQNHKLKLSKKMRRKALFLALTRKVKDDEMLIVDGLEKLEPKTKEAKKLLSNLSDKAAKKTKKTTLLISNKNTETIRATRNMRDVNFLFTNNLNAHHIANAGLLLLSKDSINTLKKTFFPQEKPQKPETKKEIRSEPIKSTRPQMTKTTKSTAKKQKPKTKTKK